jgi:anaerobic magnesium-protoporphyrin IX monomethyl ester cyclase
VSPIVGHTIVVANSYYTALDTKQTQKMRPFPPLATLYVASNLRSEGFDVQVFDAVLASGEHEFATFVQEAAPDVVVLFEDNFNFLSKMCLARMREAALSMAAAAKAQGAVVIAAGSDVSDDPEAYLSAGVDVAVFGEGDHTVMELVKSIADGIIDPVIDPASSLAVEGVAVRDADGEVHRSPRRHNERHPDVFPFPARDLIDIDQYRVAWTKAHGEFMLNMVTTRGCPFHCNWCAKPIWGQRYAMRSPEDVATEMAHVKRLYRPDVIWFADDIFGLRESWLATFADMVVELDAAIPFVMQSRADLMSPAAVAHLARAGCREVWLGVESGSQRILDAMDKGITVEQVREARERLGAHGIRASFFTQFGYPGEDWDDIRKTVDLLRETLPDDVGVSVSYPLPGTKFHTQVLDQLQARTNWDDSHSLEMLFRGTFTSPFYKRLHAVIHDELDLLRREAGLDHTPHPLLPLVAMGEQRVRVTDGWAEIEELRHTCRNERPTLLVRADPAPEAPDLSGLHNYA